MTNAETELLGILGQLLLREQRPLTFAEIVAAHPLSERSVRTVLANLTRTTYYDARPTLSGGVYSDGSLYMSSQGIDRHPWVDKLDDGSYRLSEWGWYQYFREEAATRLHHYGTPTEQLMTLTRAQVLALGGTPTAVSATRPEEESHEW